MALSSDFVQKLREYEVFKITSSIFKSRIKESVEELVNSAIADSTKKMPKTLDEEHVKNALEKMRIAYLTSLNNNSDGIDEVVDKHNIFNIPGDIDMDGQRMNEEESLEPKIQELKERLSSLHSYRQELLKAENSVSLHALGDLTKHNECLDRLEATAKQRLSEEQLIQDIFSNKPKPTLVRDLENSVMDMSIG